MGQDTPRRITAIILIAILVAAIFAASCHRISYALLEKTKGFAENAVRRLSSKEAFGACAVIGIIIAILSQQPYPLALIGLPIVLIAVMACLWVLSAPFFYMEKICLFSAGLGGGIGWLLGRGIYRPLANRWRGRWVAKLTFLVCYSLVLVIFVRGIVIFPREKIENEGMEYFMGGDDLGGPAERVGRLWKKMFSPLVDWTEKDVVNGKWAISPTYSEIVNNIANFFYVVGKGIILLIAVTVSYGCVFAILATVSLLYLVLCYSLIPALILSYPVCRLVIVVANGSVWTINDLFKANITYDTENLQYYSCMSVLAVIYAFVPALYLRYIVLEPIWRLIVRPSLTLFAVIIYGKEVVKEKQKMKEVSKELEYKNVETKQYEIIIPPKLSKRQIRADIRKYSGDASVLRRYFIGLAQRFDSKNERKLLEEEMKRLNLEKEYMDAMKALRISTHELYRVDMEEEIKRRKLEEDLDLAVLSKKAKEVELRAKIAEQEAKIAEQEAKKAQYERSINKLDKTDSAGQGKQDPVKDAIDRLKRQTIERIDIGMFRLGATIQCPICLHRSWYAIDNLKYKLQCTNCLDNFDLPSYSPDEIKWSYRTFGPFSLSGAAEGAYSTLLALRFFSKILDAGITPMLSFITKIDGSEKEIDLGLLLKESRFNNEEEVYTVFAECKTYNNFEKNDVDKLAKLAKRFPGAVLVFATMRDSLTAKEKKLLGPLVNRCRRYWKADQPYNPVLILTKTELFASMAIEYAWRDAIDKKYKKFADRHFYTDRLLHICDATQQLYLDMCPWYDEVYRKWEHKRISERIL